MMTLYDAAGGAEWSARQLAELRARNISKPETADDLYERQREWIAWQAAHHFDSAAEWQAWNTKQSEPVNALVKAAQIIVDNGRQGDTCCYQQPAHPLHTIGSNKHCALCELHNALEAGGWA